MSEPNPELLLLRRREAELLKKRNELIKRHGLAYYKPFPKQQAFHEAGIRFKRRMVRSGNRFGKSTLGCAEDCSWLLHERPWLPVDHPARRGGIPQHPVKGLVITTDWDKVDEIFTSQRGEGGKIWRFLPKDLVKPKGVRRNHSGAIDTIECKDSSLLRFDTVKSFLSNPQGSESSDWDFIHVDEPCSEEQWKAASRGLIDRAGSAWFTLTPLSEFWINDLFFPTDTGGKPRDDVWAETGTTYDNPYLSREAIEQFEKDLTDEEKQCRINGIPLHLSGLIYKQFSWDRHVLKDLPKGWKDWVTPPDDWSIYFAIDPHPQTPHAVLFCAVSPLGHRVYYTDIFEHCSIEELAKRIHAVLGKRRYIWAKCDPLGFINDPITETNMAYELERNGIYVEKATKALAHGILKVQGELNKNMPSGFPVMMFTPMCRRTLWEIQRYCWDEKENKPLDKDDHMMENMYRLEISEMRWIPYTKDNTAIEDEAFKLDLELDSLHYLD